MPLEQELKLALGAESQNKGEPVLPCEEVNSPLAAELCSFRTQVPLGKWEREGSGADGRLFGSQEKLPG